MRQPTINCSKLIKENKLSLEDWLGLMNSNKRELLIPNNYFPSDEFLNQYINKIDEYNEKSFKDLLRMLIVNSCSYGVDEYNKQFFLTNPVKNQNEYYRRLLETEAAYEGITWILDLLPNFPKKALEVLYSYQLVHVVTLPDVVVNGLFDAQVLIRARYLHNNYNVETLLTLTPQEFEVLIAKLYKKLGYEVQLTKSTRDGGKDVIADNNSVGRKERLFVECKKYKTKVNVVTARTLLGTIMDEKVTKGVLIGTSGFTRDALKFADQNPSLELIGGEELLILLNENLGKNWFNLIPLYMKEFKIVTL